MCRKRASGTCAQRLNDHDPIGQRHACRMNTLQLQEALVVKSTGIARRLRLGQSARESDSISTIYLRSQWSKRELDLANEGPGVLASGC
jgi:hypothetical protein